MDISNILFTIKQMQQEEYQHSSQLDLKDYTGHLKILEIISMDGQILHLSCCYSSFDAEICIDI